MSQPQPPSLALALQQRRTARGLTQEELAERAGVSVRTLSDIERGVSRFPHRDTLRLLGEALDLTPDEIVALQQVARHPPIASVSGSVANQPSRAPDEETPLIGREREVQALRQMLTDGQHHLITLTGPAGIGKTRLALTLAQSLRQEFAERVTVVDLTSVTDPAYVVAALAHALDLRERGGQPILETLIGGLADQRRLLVVDSAERALEARPVFSAILAHCHAVALLLTSRHPLEITGERIFPVPPLATPDLRKPMPPDQLLSAPAVALFIERAMAGQTGYAVTPVVARTSAKICVRLGGIPLAIELAASWSDRLAPQEILAQLAAGSGGALLALLTRRTGGGPARQRSMRDALAWSYHLLDAQAQVIFRRLGVFVGSWSLEGAEAVCAPPASADVELVDALTRLARHSLIFPAPTHDGSPRFTMHAVIASYAATLLDERRERAAIARRHAEYYADLAERLEQGLTGAEQAQSLARLVDEYENIRAALLWTREHRELDLGLRLVGALWWFWETRGYVTEGREWAEGMLRLLESGGSARDESAARAYYCATILAAGRQDYARAERYAHVFLEKTDSPPKRARALLTLGNIAKFKGERAQASAFYADGLAALRELHDTKGTLVALNNLSALTIEQGDLAQALPLVEESLAIKRQIGDQRGVAVSLMNLGEIEKLRGAMAAARQSLAEGLQMFEELDDRQGIALALNNLGELAYAQGDDAEAISRFEASLRCAEQTEDMAGVARARLRLGEALARQGAHTQAEGELRASLALFESLGQRAEATECLIAQASLAWNLGQHDATDRLLADVGARLAGGDIGLPQAAQAEYERLLAVIRTTTDQRRPAIGD
ncbi:MAG TPA: tetratricopeptide repeat protein [Ktedonobacterales bacterium]